MASRQAGAIQAVLFDLDGTLVDSELQTDQAIAEVMEHHGRPGVTLPPNETRGRSWPDIAAALLREHRLAVPPEQVAAELVEAWASGIDQIEPIPGAVRAVSEAAMAMKVAVVSSSPRNVIDRFLDRLGVSGEVPATARIGADEIRRHKPHPEGFLLAAERFQVMPQECVVFEDSRAGLEAARSAGMWSVAVLCRCAEPELCRSLATRALWDYEALPAGFWQDLASKGARVLEAEWKR
ncbi:MAG: HAD family phosphatase [Deltaproteobacteria bacterium]|nr:HAD family phosphatase [Deltaproteobacteria bacterium]